MGFHYVTQADLTLMLQPTECWNYRCVLPCPVPAFIWVSVRPPVGGDSLYKSRSKTEH
jgi:hypothetical protein